MPYRDMDLGDTSLPKHSEAWKYHLNRILNVMKKFLSPAFRYTLQAVVGLFGIALICGVCWLLTVGAHRTGVLVGHRVFGVDMPTDWGPNPAPALTWALGILVITGPFWLAALGRWFISLLPGQD